jgi:protein-S-isoprenylcysteine O-methyltransferase Ste14
LILIAFGSSLISSPLTLVVTVALMLVLEVKSRLEESMLAQRFFGVRRVQTASPLAIRPGIH